MTTELSPYQQDLLKELAERDGIYRSLRKNARNEALALAVDDINEAKKVRDVLARKAVGAGIPRTTVHQVGLHSTDAATLRKLLWETK